MEIASVYDALGYVQGKMAVPKSERNDFGGYQYRNLEGINLAAKPVCAEVGASYILTYDLIHEGERFYIRATASFFWQGQMVQACALAREQSSKKGMDEAQITGSASSYAGKYALQALFAIDGEDDPDSRDNTLEGTVAKPMGDSQYDRIMDLASRFAEMRARAVDDVLQKLFESRAVSATGASDMDHLTEQQALACEAVLKSWITTASKMEA